MRYLPGLVIFVTVVTVASSASAETFDATVPLPHKNAYAEVGASFGMQRAFHGGLQVDGGIRLGDTPMFVHALLASGKSGSDGSYQQARGGIEARACIAQDWLCGFSGVDIGYQHDHVVDEMLLSTNVYMTSSHDAIAVPRAGVEIGHALKFRVALELPLYQSIDEDQRGVGTEISAGLGYAF
jgi:hypothetical protein